MPSAEPHPEVLIFYMDAGGGHRAAARALATAAEERQAPFAIRLLSLQDALEPLDFVKRYTGRTSEETYNGMIRKGQTRFLVPMLWILHGVIRLRQTAFVERVAEVLTGFRPGAVVSVLPNFNGVLRDAVRRSHPGVPFIVALTDLADFPPHFWIEPGIDRVIVGSSHAARQARELGLLPAQVSQTSGMPLRPAFHRGGGPEARERVRAELGFVDEDFVVLLLFGGKGAPEMQPLSERLLASPAAFRVVAVCGDNEALAGRLRPLEERGRGRLRVFGYTDRVADLMAAADLLATKPGPGSLAEAFHQRLPVIVTCDARTIPQERYNARFVREQGLGIVVGSWKQVPGAAAAFAREEKAHGTTRTRLRALPANRAVYEILEILQGELSARGALSRPMSETAS
jgi:UDP-N-acetylglucosamine:LPS N-acetylglucosamine transferase